jgi:alpha-galactosidase
MSLKIFIVALLVVSSVFGIDNGLGLTPPMGWNSWNHFGCKIN